MENPDRSCQAPGLMVWALVLDPGSGMSYCPEQET